MNKITEALLIEKVALSPRLLRRARKGALKKSKLLTAHSKTLDPHSSKKLFTQDLATARSNQARLFGGDKPPYPFFYRTGGLSRRDMRINTRGEQMFFSINRAGQPGKGKTLGERIKRIIRKRPRPFRITGRTLLPRHPGAGI